MQIFISDFAKALRVQIVELLRYTSTGTIVAYPSLLYLSYYFIEMTKLSVAVVPEPVHMYYCLRKLYKLLISFLGLLLRESCEYCGSSMHKRSILRHIRAVHPESRCLHCNYVARNQSKLYQHKTLKHSFMA
jgi:hypothetical protein